MSDGPNELTACKTDSEILRRYRQKLPVIVEKIIENEVNHVPWIFVNGIRANLATEEFMGKLKQAGIEPVSECMLVMLNDGEY